MTGEELIAARAAHRAAAASPDAPVVECVRACAFPTLPELAGLRPRIEPLVEAGLEARTLIELELWPGERRYAPSELVTYLHAAVGDRRPLRDYKQQAEMGKLSWLAAEVYQLLLTAPGALGPVGLRDKLGAQGTSVLGVRRALTELAHTLKVTRVGRTDEGDELWMPLALALPGAMPDEGAIPALAEASAALISYWLDAMVCATAAEAAAALGPLFPASRIHSTLGALAVAGRLAAAAIDGRPAYAWPPTEARPPLP